jgi:hypothetical protein
VFRGTKLINLDAATLSLFEDFIELFRAEYFIRPELSFRYKIQQDTLNSPVVFLVLLLRVVSDKLFLI